jgi:hypothetical protein
MVCLYGNQGRLICEENALLLKFSSQK